MVSVGTSSLEYPFARQKAEHPTPTKIASQKINIQTIKPLLLETNDKVFLALTNLGISIAARHSGFSPAIGDEINADRYNFVFIDYGMGQDIVDTMLNRYAQIAPYLSIVIVDGPYELMSSGAVDCIPIKELTSSRLHSTFINAERFRKLHLHSLNILPEKAPASNIDPLTSLPSRSRFKAHLSDLAKTAANDKAPISLIILDIDSFKGLNESKGHEFGDLILKTVAERLAQFAPEHSIVGRLGDDEFALLLHSNDLAKISDTTIAARLSHELRQPYFLDGQSTILSATMGIAKFEEHDTPDTLLHKSMSALYMAKRDKNRFMVYTKKEDAERRQQLRLVQELPEAISNNDLRVHYQPMIRMHDSTVIGVEALVRWQHPLKGLLFPDSFIPLAEDSGCVEPLTRWVLDAAIKQGSEWLKQGHRLSVSVNISALILHNPIFPDIVNRLLEQSQFPAELLKLEITESAIISDVVRATDVVTRLHELGVKVSIDDFGTGYTSLAYIRKLPVDEIKIDKSFVLNMNTVSDDAVIVRTLLELARNLDLAVVAEGVEDRETWYMLAGLGCHVAQGYYMSRPVDVETLQTWLKHSPWAAAR